ncbi:MAG: type IV toxin-antitoxin system AbiEi family antitoxin domain-containing protein [Bacilli bacterium]
MKYEKTLLEFLKNNFGYITTSDFLNLGINKPLINKFIEGGLIRKVGHGLYMDNNIIEDEYYILQKKYSDIIFSYNTALNMLNLTNRAPYSIDITACAGKTIKGDFNIHYVTKQNFDVGILEVMSPYGNLVKVYNAERCICDMLKKEKEFDLEQQNRVLNYYFNSKDKNLDRLLDYAKKFKVYDKVYTIMKVMMK